MRGWSGGRYFKTTEGKKNKENDFKAEFPIRQDQPPCVITLELPCWCCLVSDDTDGDQRTTAYLKNKDELMSFPRMTSTVK